ncbi:MAG: hypothetical protein ABI165_05915 [Bryobacteraceae bacterium]
MDSVEQIEQAIDSLPADEFSRLAAWLRERAQQRWDDQMDRDSASGKLDFLFDEAESERNALPQRSVMYESPQRRYATARR